MPCTFVMNCTHTHTHTEQGCNCNEKNNTYSYHQCSGDLSQEGGVASVTLLSETSVACY
jgi:hypothetical protein